MNLKKYLAIIAVLLLATSNAVARESMREKADRYYKYEEWEAAVSAYQKVLADNPTDMRAYGRSTVICGMLGLPDKQVEILERTQSYGLPLIDLFAEVRKSAFEIGKPEILENFMLLVMERQPWLKRNIELRLLQYYDFRNDAPRMIALSDSLLAVNPRDPSTLRVKARGYMLEGNYGIAEKTYLQLLALRPDDFDAILNIGIIYYSEVETRKLPSTSPEAAEARKYLEKAFQMRPTEHLRQLIARLESPSRNE